MEEKVKEEVKEQNELSVYPVPTGLEYYYKIARFVFIILLVASLGVFLINQALEYSYRAEFLKAPCSLCKELEGCFTYRIEVGGDSSPFNNKEIEINLSLLTSP